MTDQLLPLSTLPAVPSQEELYPIPLIPPVADSVVQKVETVEEEPYTIKCICNFSDDDGNTIYCETCDTWQHIYCFYPNNREEAIREDFAHSCAECKPRSLDRQRAIERTLRLKTPVPNDGTDRRTKRPPSKSHKKKPRLTDISTLGLNGVTDLSLPGAAQSEQHPPAHKKSKSLHRPSQSVSSQPPKRSPSHGHSRPNSTHPLSPANTPPNLPEDFEIHHFSPAFCSLYNDDEVPETHNNKFASIAIPTRLSRWLREPETMQQEVGRAHSDVFQESEVPSSDKTPTLEVKDETRSLSPVITLRWRSLKSTTSIEKDVPLIELHGEIGFQKDYCANADNLWADLSSPLPFVFFHPVLPLYVDTRREGSLARYVRRSCKPNAQLDTYLSGGSDYHFWLVSDRYIPADENLTLPWDFGLEKSVSARWLHMLGLSDDDVAIPDESDLDESEYTAISNWIDRILSEYGGCACRLYNNCAFARFHRQYLFGRSQNRASRHIKKQRKLKTQTVSPTSTSHATNSRAASEGHGEDGMNHDGGYESVSSRSKPPSRDRSPVRQGSFDQLGILTEPTEREKRKVAMVEDSFRRMEQQPPLKKKKRTSDGTTPSRLSKSRNDSTQSHGQHIDSEASRSKSGSPLSAQSPIFANTSKPSPARPESVACSPRSSSSSRPEYCSSGTQTHRADGEWFSEPAQSSVPRKKAIPLSKRLLSRRHWVSASSESLLLPPSRQPSDVTAMDLDAPLNDQTPSSDLLVDTQPSTSEAVDTAMFDAPSASPTVPTNLPLGHTGHGRAPDLRVQLPPVPAFDKTGPLASSLTTPLSASSSIVQSPFSMCNTANPFMANGTAMQPSPVKKKLSLSDYTKSRMNKVGAKVPSGNGGPKTSAEEAKMDITLESAPVEKQDDDTPPLNAIVPMKGHA